MPTLPPALSEKDLQFLHDTEFLTAKHHILQQLRQQLGTAQKQLQQAAGTLTLPGELWAVPPKISRGENYKLLPYLVLDYPRIFQQEGVFAYRTMVWWGHEISCTLHLAGNYWQRYQHQLLYQLQQAPAENWWVCVHDSPWEYHFRRDNYKPLQEVKADMGLAALAEKPFFKLSRQLPLSDYLQLPAFCIATLQELAVLLSYND